MSENNRECKTRRGGTQRHYCGYAGDCHWAEKGLCERATRCGYWRVKKPVSVRDKKGKK